MDVLVGGDGDRVSGGGESGGGERGDGGGGGQAGRTMSQAGGVSSVYGGSYVQSSAKYGHSHLNQHRPPQERIRVADVLC